MLLGSSWFFRKLARLGVAHHSANSYDPLQFASPIMYTTQKAQKHMFLVLWNALDLSWAIYLRAAAFFDYCVMSAQNAVYTLFNPYIHESVRNSAGRWTPTSDKACCCSMEWLIRSWWFIDAASRGSFFLIYPLVMTDIAMENHHVWWGNPLFLLSC